MEWLSILLEGLLAILENCEPVTRIPMGRRAR